jgi:hypothetical protein
MINNTHFAQYIPPTAMHYVTGTWTDAAGAVTDTICRHKAAGAETAVVNVPIMIPSNSIALQGAKLTSIEFDYEQLLAGTTSTTAVLKKVTRGADGAVAVVSTPTITTSLDATAAKARYQRKQVVTLTTPEWVDNDVYFLLQVTFVCGGTVTLDILSAVANFVFKA